MASVELDSWVNLLNTGKYSDFTIICEDAEFKVHSAVVCTVSPMLDAAFKGPFEEATNRQIKFPEENPEILSRVIRFMYTNDYDDSEAPCYARRTENDKPTDHESSLSRPEETHITPLENQSDTLLEKMSINALVYKCADMLGVKNLKTLACKRFLKQTTSAYSMKGFAQPLETMFESTHPNDPELRLTVVRMCLLNYDQIKDQPKTLQILKLHEPNVWTVFTQMPKSVDEGTHKQLKSSFSKLATYLYEHDTATQCPECDRRRAWCDIERDLKTSEVISVDIICNEHQQSKVVASFPVS